MNTEEIKDIIINLSSAKGHTLTPHDKVLVKPFELAKVIASHLKKPKIVYPQKKESPKGMQCSCDAWSYADCGCGADWADNDGWNDCIDAMNNLNKNF